MLFSPANVQGAIATSPTLATLLPDPATEGVASEAFPESLRNTKREVYRWIANTRYEQLADAVEHLERVYAAGCTFGHLLKTTSR